MRVCSVGVCFDCLLADAFLKHKIFAESVSEPLARIDRLIYVLRDQLWVSYCDVISKRAFQ